MFYINVNGIQIGIDAITVTPEFAKKALEDAAMDENYRNRTVNESTVKLYAEQMKKGNWTFNCETVKFNPQGRLNDGYHRFNACIVSNSPFTVLAAYGVPDELVSTIDVGRKRSVEDILDFWRVERIKGVVSVVKRKIKLDKRLKWKDSSSAVMCKSDEEYASEYISHKKDYDEFKLLGEKYKKESKGILSATDTGGFAAHLVMTLGWGKDYVDEFFTKLANTSWSDKSIFSTTSKALSKEGMKSKDIYNEYILCWNSFVKGNILRRYSELDWFIENGSKKTKIDSEYCIGSNLTSDDFGITNANENERELAYAEAAD